MTDTTLLAPSVRRLLQQHYGDTIDHVQATVGGFSNLTLAVDLGGMPRIIKVATLPQKRADLRRESAVLLRLAATSLPIARQDALLEDHLCSVLVLERLPGHPALTLLPGPVARVEALFSQLGGVLAQVHQQTLAVDAPIDPDLHLPSRARDVARQISTMQLATPIEAALINGLAHTQALPPLRLVHGDPGAHNLLWADRLSGLLDWEWAGWGNPATDLAWVIWTTHFRKLPERVRSAFWDGYGSLALDTELLQQLALAQIAAILVRVADLPDARAEWMRRLEWTINADWITTGA
jgi:Ser/Thr protein kinase RdoA (MazF antagonist)